MMGLLSTTTTTNVGGGTPSLSNSWWWWKTGPSRQAKWAGAGGTRSGDGSVLPKRSSGAPRLPLARNKGARVFGTQAKLDPGSTAAVHRLQRCQAGVEKRTCEHVRSDRVLSKSAPRRLSKMRW
ncbi:unnamed protein product [Prorocentrum cordatum]|uniref:Uncharacterized protein n=1 Tax=Prorocentrum cordatum TaxID=2364126 RepID=A0ABN9WVG9_9DINO|nr:unnamed protein product [Polarella glacialis]